MAVRRIESTSSHGQPLAHYHQAVVIAKTGPAFGPEAASFESLAQAGLAVVAAVVLFIVLVAGVRWLLART